ncbi:sugar phosphate isomerase/epimerase family protein [Paenibacillus sacheonensis]|uniref:Sugar phosphate isomerase/epimerase n=1 Tax=Paenibacillus sacheonensis TaxID=742054 RepID=A0A7X4YM03_9BACL|nr:hypothetical protein [Paenibacillus sacheonensis]MBM7565850.1 hypothetical protein [Paenibacillus sacheonensis]NBC68831.1 hypothetical protein [Paenibacillus sacheonensis]
MKLLRVKSLWEYVSFEGSPLAIRLGEDRGALFARIAEAGYGAVESPLPVPDQDNLFKELLRTNGLSFIAQTLTDGPDHAASFRAQAERAASFNPMFIVSQSSKDSDSLSDQLHYFEQALQTEDAIGLAVAHETHRGRALYTPWNTAELLNRLDSLKLNADFSHWCCVTESLLESHASAVHLACSRSVHIHGRVGHAEGPQVADPRAPEYARELAAHEAWWKQIVRARLAAGADTITFTPEFGPPGYMPTLPFTRQPVANLWEVNLWMAERFETLAMNWAEEFAREGAVEHE